MIYITIHFAKLQTCPFHSGHFHNLFIRCKALNQTVKQLHVHPSSAKTLSSWNGPEVGSDNQVTFNIDDSLSFELYNEQENVQDYSNRTFLEIQVLEQENAEGELLVLGSKTISLQELGQQTTEYGSYRDFILDQSSLKFTRYPPVLTMKFVHNIKNRPFVHPSNLRNDNKKENSAIIVNRATKVNQIPSSSDHNEIRKQEIVTKVKSEWKTKLQQPPRKTRRKEQPVIKDIFDSYIVHSVKSPKSGLQSENKKNNQHGASGESTMSTPNLSPIIQHHYHNYNYNYHFHNHSNDELSMRVQRALESKNRDLTDSSSGEDRLLVDDKENNEPKQTVRYITKSSIDARKIEFKLQTKKRVQYRPDSPASLSSFDTEQCSEEDARMVFERTFQRAAARAYEPIGLFDGLPSVIIPKSKATPVLSYAQFLQGDRY